MLRQTTERELPFGHRRSQRYKQYTQEDAVLMRVLLPKQVQMPEYQVYARLERGLTIQDDF